MNGTESDNIPWSYHNCNQIYPSKKDRVSRIEQQAFLKSYIVKYYIYVYHLCMHLYYFKGTLGPTMK